MVLSLISGMIWQIFLIFLAQGLKSRWLVRIAWIPTACILGVCMMVLAEVIRMALGGEIGYNKDAEDAVRWIIFGAGVIYLVTYLVVLGGLNDRIEKVIKENE